MLEGFILLALLGISIALYVVNKRILQVTEDMLDITNNINRIFMVDNTFYSQGEPYELHAYVHARNYESSKAQFKWLAENSNCLCTDCRNSWVSKYSTLIMNMPVNMPAYNMCTA